MALSDMTILLADGVCSDCGDRPDPGRSSHRPSLLEEIYSAVVRISSTSRNFFCLDAFGGWHPDVIVGGSSPVVRPGPGDASRSHRSCCARGNQGPVGFR